MDFDAILRTVLEQVKAAGIPAADTIDEHVLLNKRAKKRYGRCIHTAEKYTIELSAFLENADPVFVYTVAAHEILHTCPGCMNHGAKWKQYAAQLKKRYGYEITRTANVSLLPETGAPEAKYAFKCTMCCAVIRRQKMSKLVQHLERYRCKCGGKLVRLF